MPELPDITVYVEAIERRIAGLTLDRVRLHSPFLLRTTSPPLSEAEGRPILTIRRLGKRVVVCLEGGIFLVFHLMVAGRFHWKSPGASVPKRGGLAALDTEAGTLLLTEAGSRRRASLHAVRGEAALAELDPGGIEPLLATAEEFAAAMRRESHTLKRALTDPRILSGIGNAYSDEILHRARLSPLLWTSRIDDAAMEGLHRATRDTLVEWTDRLRREVGDGFPEKVTAFRPEMAVHGRYRLPCPECGSPVQRIRYLENETDYCPTCQTGGKLLADRALSRLLKKDWPRSLDELAALTGKPRP